ncbi:hypothetical protein CDV55_107961 [Aspergillus turcosus]|nr:hypothetical protein CDV55_107961 [Aspergillus turcosus]
MEDRGFTLRAIISGLLVGVLISVSNTYYGLRVGSGSRMYMVSGLLGFAGFKVLSRYTTRALHPEENVLIISVATATGCMPLTAGLIGAIPAIEYLIGPSENGPLVKGLGSLTLWSIGLCFFGIVFTALLREQFVEREPLPWPGARAASQLIRTLHRISSKQSTLPSSQVQEEDGETSNEPPTREFHAVSHGVDDIDWEVGMNRLIQGAIGSGIFVQSVVLKFVPILHELPVFGHGAAQWAWNMDLSPGFLGQGIVIGPYISLHMLTGAIVGWGILAPYAKSRGWAPGLVDDWTAGARGWIIWVSMASLLADASVKLGWFVLRPVWRYYLARGNSHQQTATAGGDYTWRQSQEEEDQNYRSGESGADPEILADEESHSHTLGERTPLLDSRRTLQSQETILRKSHISTRTLGLAFLVSLIVLSQLVFAALISHSNPSAVIINLISAAMAVAGASQSGDLAFDLKIGSMMGASPDAQTHGQLIGSVFGAFIACGIYKLYTSRYAIPGSLFRVPSAYLVLSTSRLLLGHGLPEGVGPFVLAAAVFSIVSSVVKMRYEDRRWEKFIPSGVSFAIGIYLLPSYSITCAVGGLIYEAYRRYNNNRQGTTIVFASGLILGESVASLVMLALLE